MQKVKLGLTVPDPQYVAVLTYLSKAEQDSYNVRKKAFNWALGIGIAFVVAVLSVSASLAFPPFAAIIGYALGSVGFFVFIEHKKH